MTHPIPRRSLLGSGLAALALATSPSLTHPQESTMTTQNPAWPNDARLAVSFSLMFEAGGQPISGAGGVIPDPIKESLPDLPTNAFFQYGVYEGVPRLLDLMDKHGVKLSSFMIGPRRREGARSCQGDRPPWPRSRRPRPHLGEQLLPGR